MTDRSPPGGSSAAAELFAGLGLLFLFVLGINQFVGHWVDVGGWLTQHAPTAPAAASAQPPAARSAAPPPNDARQWPCELSGKAQDACRQAKAYAKERVTAIWSADQWPCLDSLWHGESDWDAWAVNPSSGAYGIPQALGHGHVFDLGDWEGQVNWGLDYIKGRRDYGSPCAAWRLWASRSPHWY